MIATKDKDGNIFITVKVQPEDYAAFLAAPGQLTMALMGLEGGIPNYAETGLYFLLNVVEQMLPDENQLRLMAAVLPPSDPLISQQPFG